MAHPQNTPRGLFAKAGPLTIGANTLTSAASGLKLSAGIALSAQTDYITQTSTYVKLPTGLSISAQTDVITQTSTYVKLPTGLSLSAKTAYMTQNSTAVVMPGGIALSGKTKYITGNSSGWALSTVSTMPATRVVGGICFVSNSTGKMLAYHSTGTTWVYASKTSVLA